MEENKITCTFENKRMELKIVIDDVDGTKWRDACLKAYTCALMDIPSSEFEAIKRDCVRKDEKEKQALIEQVMSDVKGRLRYLLEEE